jgi:hypothetical protein
VKGPRCEEEEPEQSDLESVRAESEGRQSVMLSRKVNIQQYKRENIKDGDYVYAPDGLMEGVYFKGGIVIDFKQEDKLEKEFNEEWKDDSLASSSVIKLRKISGTTYFSKGIL